MQSSTEKIWHEPQTLGLNQPATARLAFLPADWPILLTCTDRLHPLTPHLGYTFSSADLWDLANYLFQQSEANCPTLHVLPGSCLFTLHPRAHFPACDRNMPAFDASFFRGPNPSLTGSCLPLPILSWKTGWGSLVAVHGRVNEGGGGSLILKGVKCMVLDRPTACSKGTRLNGILCHGVSGIAIRVTKREMKI